MHECNSLWWRRRAADDRFRICELRSTQPETDNPFTAEPHFDQGGSGTHVLRCTQPCNCLPGKCQNKLRDRKWWSIDWQRFCSSKPFGLTSRQVPRCKPGWLRAIFDQQIGVALTSIHNNPNIPWTVESLAEAAGTSRSAFAERFKGLLGQTPLEYVAEWWMQKAVQLLQRRDTKLVDVA